jgi:hypothetical protein
VSLRSKQQAEGFCGNAQNHDSEDNPAQRLIKLKQKPGIKQFGKDVSPGTKRLAFLLEIFVPVVDGTGHVNCLQQFFPQAAALANYSC